MALGLFVLLLQSGAFTWHRNDVLFCRDCGTERDLEVTRYFGWDGPRVPFAGNVDRLRPSNALVDLFPPDHEHRWGQYGGPRWQEGFWGILAATN